MVAPKLVSAGFFPSKVLEQKLRIPMIIPEIQMLSPNTKFPSIYWLPAVRMALFGSTAVTEITLAGLKLIFGVWYYFH